MPDQENSLSHVNLLTLVSRCLSGDWLIDPQWMLRHADQILREENRATPSGDQSQRERPTRARLLTRDMQVSSKADQAAAAKGSLLGEVHVLGTIYKYGGYYSYGSKDYLAMLGVMARDERVGGVKLVIDSPGGQASGTREFYEAVRDFPKPIMVCVDGYMASAAYYLGCGASRIVATQPTDQIGSIGTYRTYADFLGLYEKMGLKLYEVYAPDASEKNADSRQIIESLGKTRSLAEKDVAMLNDQFLADVRAGRGERLTGQGADPMKGGLYYAADAVKNGLIDELLPEGDTLAVLADMTVTNQRSSITMSFIQSLKGLIDKEEKGGETPDAAAQVATLTAQLGTLTTERDTLTAQVGTLTTQVGTLTTERNTLANQVTTLTTERDEALTQAAAYGEQPGEKPTKVKKAADEQSDSGAEKTPEQVIDGLESTQLAREQGLWD